MKKLFSIKEAIIFIIENSRLRSEFNQENYTISEYHITWEKLKKTQINGKLPSILDWKGHYYDNSCTTQRDLQVQCYMDQTVNGFVYFFEARVSGSSDQPWIHYVAEGDSDLLALLPSPAECGDYRCAANENWFLSDIFNRIAKSTP